MSCVLGVGEGRKGDGTDALRKKLKHPLANRSGIAHPPNAL